MNNSKQNYKYIASLLETVISRPPARAGLRLLPEYELASRLNVSRMKVRRALDLLFKKGYLSRTRGCGTFIRKVASGLNSRHYDQILGIESLDIFDHNAMDSGRTADVSQQKLKLSFLHDFNFYDTNIVILEGMKRAAKSRGHSFSDISIVKEDRIPLEADEIRKLIKLEKHDGYLISLQQAPKLHEAIDGLGINSVFIYPGAHQINYEPMIQMNLFEAAERGLRKLYDSGYRRIAMLSLARNYRLPSIYDESVAYDLTVKDLGLEYQNKCNVGLDVISITKTLYDMFDSPQTAPDAIYIGDEHILPTFIMEMEQRNIKLGRDLGVVTQHSSSRKNFGDIEFSKMEFDVMEFGAIAVDALIQSIMTAGRKVSNLSLNASWQPGKTHLKD